MSRVMIVTAHRPDRAPGQRFRFEQYLSYLARQGFDFTFANLLDEHDDRIFYRPGAMLQKAKVLAKGGIRRFRDVIRAPCYDATLVFREAFPLGTTLIERALHHSGVPIVFDFDDAIWLDATSEANRRFAFLKRSEKTADIIRMSSIVMAGNQYLADYARQFHDDVRVVPTTIDTDQYRPASERPDGGRVCIGWSGSPTTIQYFQKVIPALMAIKAKYGDRVSFTVIGEERYRCAELGIEGLPWRRQTELDDLRAFDIGIMPLPDDDWTRGKCGLKGLSYMALEIPPVMSPVGVNGEIIESGLNGLLATTTDEWVEALSLLVESPELRQRLGRQARKTVLERYSVTIQEPRYLAIFRDACSRKRR